MKILSFTTLSAALLTQSASAGVVSDFQFNTLNDLEGWTPLANISGSLTADGDSLNGVASSGDPRLARTALNITTTEGWDSVIFRVRETEPTDGPFFVDPWSSGGLALVFNGNASFGGGSQITIGSGSASAVASGDSFFTVTFDISSLGTTSIAQMRLDPIGVSDAAGNTFEVDFIQITEVPEPSSLALLGLGGLLIARRRRG